MLSAAAEAYGGCCSRIDELRPGKLVWLGYSAQGKCRDSIGLFKPVVLTLQAPSDSKITLEHRGHLKAAKNSTDGTPYSRSLTSGRHFNSAGPKVVFLHTSLNG